MNTIYEVETEKIKIKYEKVIGLVKLNNILLGTYLSSNVYIQRDKDFFLYLLKKRRKNKNNL